MKERQTPPASPTTKTSQAAAATQTPKSQMPTSAAPEWPVDVQIPDDFPRDLAPAALSGAQPKVAARLIDGCYVVGMSAEERLAHYRMCQDLVDQLLDHFARKMEHSPQAVEQLVQNFHHTALSHHWGTTVVENRWIEQQLRTKLAPPGGGTALPAPSGDRNPGAETHGTESL